MLTKLRVYSLQNDAITEDDNDESRFVNMGHWLLINGKKTKHALHASVISHR